MCMCAFQETPTIYCYVLVGTNRWPEGQLGIEICHRFWCAWFRFITRNHDIAPFFDIA